MAFENIELDSNKRNAKNAQGGDYVFVVESQDVKGATIRNVDNDIVAIEGNAEDYVVKATSAGVIVTKNLEGLSGAELKAAKQFKLTITLQKENAKKGVDAGVVTLAFADGAIDLTRDGKNIVTGEGVVVTKKAKEAGALDIEIADETFGSVTAEEPTEPQPGQSFTLTTGVDAPELSANADTIEGAVTGLTSTNTLNAGDKIDGGAGVDTLKLQQSTNFTGFTGEGFLKNVEVLEITNTSTLSRSFDAKGVTGLETVKINANNANYTLTNLAAAGVAVEVAGMDDDTLNVGFATDVTKGEADALSVKVTDVGAAKTTTAAQKDAKVVAAGIENLTIEAAGTANFVDLSGVTVTGTADQALTIKGAGALTVADVDGALVSVDASAATGKLDLDLTSATVINSVKAGSADDVVTVDSLKVDAQLDGGAGNDTLVLDGLTAGVYQPGMTGFETLAVTGLTGAVTFAASNTVGLTKLAVKDGVGSAGFTLAELSATSFGIDLVNTDAADAATGQDIAYTSASDLTVTTRNEDAAVTGTSIVQLKDNIVASAATSLTVNVAKNTELSGNVTAAAATSVNVNVAKDAALAGDITAAKAANVNLSFDSDVSGNLVFAAATDITLTATAAQTALVLDAAKAQALTINSSKDVTLAATSDLESLANLTAQGIGGLDLDAIAIGAKAASVTVNAANAKSAVDVEIDDYAANGGQVVFTGSTLAANTLTIGTGRNEVAVTGGIANDTVNYNTVLTSSDEASININLGSVSTNDKLVLDTGAHDWTNASVTLSGVDVVSGATSLTLKAAVVSGQTIDLSAIDVTLKGTDGADTIDVSNLSTTGDLIVEGGKGNDTIKLGAAVETVKFAATAVDNGVDTISGFTAGTGSTADVLDVSALVGTTQTTAFGAANGASALADGTVVSYTNAGTALDAAGVAALFAAAQTAGKYTAGASSDYVFVEQSGNTAKLWVINNDATAAVTAAEVKLVGTVNADAALVIENFA